MTNKHSVAFCLTVRSPSVSKPFRLSAIPLNQNQGIFIFIYIIMWCLNHNTCNTIYRTCFHYENLFNYHKTWYAYIHADHYILYLFIKLFKEDTLDRHRGWRLPVQYPLLYKQSELQMHWQSLHSLFRKK